MPGTVEQVETSACRLWYNNWVQGNAKGRVLDVGKSKYWYYGFPTLDKDPKMRPTYIGDIENAPFPADAFDTVLCNGMFEFVNNPQRMIDEVLRITRDKAIFGFVGKDYIPYRKPWRFYQGKECISNIVQVQDFGDEYHFMVSQWPRS